MQAQNTSTNCMHIISKTSLVFQLQGITYLDHFPIWPQYEIAFMLHYMLPYNQNT